MWFGKCRIHTCIHTYICYHCGSAHDFTSHQGIYRLSGVSSKIQAFFTTTLEKQKSQSFDDEEVDTVTGALKLAFKTLTEPLFPFTMYHALIACSRMHVHGICPLSRRQT
jgi:hypothetical protein